MLQQHFISAEKALSVVAEEPSPWFPCTIYSHGKSSEEETGKDLQALFSLPRQETPKFL